MMEASVRIIVKKQQKGIRSLVREFTQVKEKSALRFREYWNKRVRYSTRQRAPDAVSAKIMSRTVGRKILSAVRTNGKIKGRICSIFQGYFIPIPFLVKDVFIQVSERPTDAGAQSCWLALSATPA